MEEIIQPPVPESKYAPFTLEDYQMMVADLETIGSYLPEHKLDIFWQRCTMIRGKSERRPCSCGSAGALWAACVEDIRNFVNARK